MQYRIAEAKRENRRILRLNESARPDEMLAHAMAEAEMLGTSHASTQFIYRRVPSDPSAREIIIDHHSGIGRVPKQDPEIVFPRTALANLHKRGVVGSSAPFHFPSWAVCAVVATLKTSWGQP